MLNLRDLALLLAALYLLYAYLIHPLFLSPLAKIPSAHPTAPISPLWIHLQRHRCTENRAIYAAHQKHGPVVRLGPAELSVNTVDNGLRTIYAGGFEKHPWYHLFANYGGVPTMFSTCEGRPHALRKRMLSNLYAKSTLQASRGLAAAGQAIVRERLVPSMLGAMEGGKGEVDLYLLMNYATMDLVTAYIFGLKSGSNFLQDTATADWWLALYQSRKKFVFWIQELPTLTSVLARVGIYLCPRWVAAANIQLEDWCLSLCDAAEAHSARATASEEAANPQDTPVIHRQLHSALTSEVLKSSGSSTPETAQTARIATASELLDQLSAGFETSSITLTYLFWELARNPPLQSRLRAELLTAHPPLRHDDALPPTAQAPLPSAKTLDALPVLHATLMETLRLHAAIPGPEPRITPAKADVQLGPYTRLPPNIRVSASPYSLHRNAAVFPDPLAFTPDRWLAAEDDARKAEMHRWFWAFSSGGRMCIGSNLAVLQMKLLVAGVVGSFVVGPVLDEGVGGVGQEDTYTAQPRGKRLVVGIARV